VSLRQDSLQAGCKPKRIGVVASDRDVGSEIAKLLEASGHEVSILSATEPEPPGATPLHVPLHRANSYRLYESLRHRPLDLVLFADGGGAAFYSVVAKHQGLSFPSTSLAVYAVRDAVAGDGTSRRFPTGVDELEAEFMVRESARLATAVVAQTPHALERMVADEIPPPETESESEGPSPQITVCITVHDRHEFLSQAIASIEAQDHPSVEVVLVDDGSTSSEALALIGMLRAKFDANGWTIVRQDNRYLGAARNTAVRHAHGEFVLFLDDDDLLRPEALSTLSRVAVRTGADILSSFVDFFSTSSPPDPSARPEGRWLPVGAAVEAGAFRNVFGSASALIRRTAFVALGGFSEDFGVGYEDWELYARASLAGYELQCVPEFLLWYRKLDESMLSTTSVLENRARALRPYRDSAPSVDGIVRLAVGCELRAGEHASELAEKDVRIAELSDQIVEEKERSETLEAALDRLRRREDSDVEILRSSARLLAETGEREATEVTLTALEALLARADLPRVSMESYSDGAEILAVAGSPERALEWLASAQRAGAAVEDQAVHLRASLREGAALTRLDRHESAAGSLARAAALADQTGDRQRGVEARIALGRAQLSAGEPSGAWEHFRAASLVSRECGFGKLLAASLLAMAPLASSYGEDGAALILDAVRVAKETKSARVLLEVMADASLLLAELGRDESVHVLSAARALAAESGNAMFYERLGARRLEALEGVP